MAFAVVEDGLDDFHRPPIPPTDIDHAENARYTNALLTTTTHTPPTIESAPISEAVACLTKISPAHNPPPLEFAPVADATTCLPTDAPTHTFPTIELAPIPEVTISIPTGAPNHNFPTVEFAPIAEATTCLPMAAHNHTIPIVELAPVVESATYIPMAAPADTHSTVEFTPVTEATARMHNHLIDEPLLTVMRNVQGLVEIGGFPQFTVPEYIYRKALLSSAKDKIPGRRLVTRLIPLRLYAT